jgi:hypothetical protein
MAHHRVAHPQDVDGCFGCKVLGVGYDAGHRTKTTVDEFKSRITEHRDGRQDVMVRPVSVTVTKGLISE